MRELLHSSKKSGAKAAMHGKAEDIHDWRVSIKKLKAAFLFFQFFNSDFNAEAMESLKKIYKEAGVMREWQMLRKAVEKNRNVHYSHVKKRLLHHIHHHEKVALEKFQKQYKKEGEEVLKKLDKVMNGERKKTLTRNTRPYFKKKIMTVFQGMQRRDLNEAEYHELRKQLKELKYNSVYADDASLKFMKTIISERELNQLEELLGDWHDKITLIKRLHKISRSFTTDEIAGKFISLLTQHSQRAANRMLLKVQAQLDKKRK